MRVGVGAAIAYTVLLATGCASQAVNGTAQVPGPTGAATNALFDGCVAFPDEALRAAGVDPGSEEAGVAGAEFPGWKDCMWIGDWFFLDSSGTDMTMDEIRSNPRSQHFRDVVVGGRSAVEHRPTGERSDEACILAFDGPTGVIMFRLDKKGSERLPEDPCESLTRRAGSLIPYLP